MSDPKQPFFLRFRNFLEKIIAIICAKNALTGKHALTSIIFNFFFFCLALLKATSAQTTALVAAAQAARSSLEISKLAKKAQEISVRRANWVLQTVRTAAKAEEVAVNAIESLFM